MTHSPLMRLRVAADERGSVLVITVVVLTTLLVFAAYAIDEGIWFVHHGHLQTEADAAALAGAQDFQFPCNSEVEERIRTDVHRYDGTTVYNEQVPRTPTPSETYSEKQHNLISLVNQPNFINQSQPNESALTGSPCANKVIDVKLSETNLPSFFPFGNPKYINAQAQVAIRQKTTDTGGEPIAVNENAPRAAEAYLINESNGSVVARIRLKNQGPNGSGEEEWNNVGAAMAVPINVTNEVNKQTVANLGVRIALSGDPNNTTCPSNSQVVNCFDSSSNTATLVHIQGWSNLGAGSPTEPKARSVTLSAGTCSDGYFSSTTTTCAIGVQAHVDVGSTANPKGLTVSAEVEGGSASELTYNTSGTYIGQWTGSTALAPGSGSNPVKLKVICTKNETLSCAKTTTTTISTQRTYSAGANSGSIHSAGIYEEETTGNLLGGADSFEVCEMGNTSCTHQLVVKITTTASLENANPKEPYKDPLYVMRFGSGTSASQTGAIQCLPGGQGGFRENIEKGCEGTYGINPESPGWECPDGATPQDCVETDNGFKTGQLRQGLTKRITEPTNGTEYYCSNKWPKKSGEELPDKEILSKDSRLVTVFVTSYGSFGGSGATWYPIQTFATFYVTGWDGDPCKTDDPAGQDQVVGHFIKYTTLDASGGGTTTCEANALGQCVAVLTK